MRAITTNFKLKYEVSYTILPLILLLRQLKIALVFD